MKLWKTSRKGEDFLWKKRYGWSILTMGKQSSGRPGGACGVPGILLRKHSYKKGKCRRCAHMKGTPAR